MSHLSKYAEIHEIISRRMSLTEKKKRWLRWCIDVFLYLTVVVGLCLSLSGYIAPKNTYIRCDDVSILHKPNEDTVSISLLLGISLFLPFLMMCVFEWMHQCNAPTSATDGSPSIIALKKSFKHFLSLLVGSLFAFFIVEVLKIATSEARPHFLKSCDPKSCNSNVTNNRDQPWIHVTLDDCRNPYDLPSRLLLDTMKSFPSGHACIGIFSAVFMTIYMQLRMEIEWSVLLIAWLQTMWWAWALVCCVSRISDRRHHWWDVLAGAVIGGIASYATVAYLCDWFDSEKKRRNDGSSLEKTSDGDTRTPVLLNGNGDIELKKVQSDKSNETCIKLPNECCTLLQ